MWKGNLFSTTHTHNISLFLVTFPQSEWFFPSNSRRPFIFRNKLRRQFDFKLLKIFLFPSLHAISLEKARSATNTLLKYVRTRSNRNLNWNFAKRIWKASTKLMVQESEAAWWREERAENETLAVRKVSGNFELHEDFHPFYIKSLQVEGPARGAHPCNQIPPAKPR